MTPIALETLQLAHATLRVSSLERARAFYADVLGLHANVMDGKLELAASEGGPALITLVEQPGAQPKPGCATGLFHLAILFPTRPALAEVLARLAAHPWPVQGMSDHGVSEAIYLADPDGNGLELYVDRPRTAWPYQNGKIAMHTAALDLADLTSNLPARPARHAPAGTRLGHIHLSVSSLARTEVFYRDTIGLEVTQNSYPGALFLSADGYHHHLGANTWAHAQQPAPLDTAGLVDFTFARRDITKPRLLSDPDGIQVRLAGWKILSPSLL